MGLLTNVWTGLKVATGRAPPAAHVPFPGGGGSGNWAWSPRGAMEWTAPDPTENSILELALRWIQTNFVAAPLGVMSGAPADAQWVPAHPLTALVRNPNPVYDGRTLLQSAVLDYKFYGTAYFLKSWNELRTGVPLELWYEPYATIRPRWAAHPTATDPWIDHYEVYRDGQWIAIEHTEDVIAWTWGAPQAATRRGRDPLHALRQERALAAAVNEYLATTLQNFGVVGMLVTPKASGSRITDTDALKARIKAITTGQSRGDPLVFGDPIDVAFPGAAPNTMGVEQLDGRTEERLAAAMGLSRLVINLGKDGTFANQEGAERQAWVDCVLPLQADLVSCLNQHLLPDFTTARDETCAFDTSRIAALAPNKMEQARVHTLYISAGVVTANEVRADLGKAPHADGDTLGRPVTAVAALAVPTAVVGETPVKALEPMHTNGVHHE